MSGSRSGSGAVEFEAVELVGVEGWYSWSRPCCRGLVVVCAGPQRCHVNHELPVSHCACAQWSLAERIRHRTLATTPPSLCNRDVSVTGVGSGGVVLGGGGGVPVCGGVVVPVCGRCGVGVTRVRGKQYYVVAEMFQSLFRVPCWRGVTVQVAVWWPGWAGVCGGSVPGLSQPDEAVRTAVC